MLYLRGEVWWTKFKADGATIRRSTGETGRRKAEESARAIRAEYKKTGKVSTVHTYEEALLKWINSGAPESMHTHARCTRPYLDHVPLHQVVPAAHDMKADMLKRGLSRLTINRRLSVVKRILNVAYKEWEWLDQPLGMKIVQFSEKGTSREVFLSREEVETLLAAIRHPEVRKLTVLAAYTGLRRSELLRLKPQHWQSPYIVLTNKTKGKKPRTVPVIADLHEFMDDLPLKCSRTQLRYEFERARELINMPGLRLHDLRHTFVSWLAKDPKVPVAIIQSLAGHASIATTNKYMHLRGDTHALINDVLGQTKH